MPTRFEHIQEDDEELPGDERRRLFEGARASRAVQDAERGIAQQGFETRPGSTAAFRTADGHKVTMLFYAGISSPETDAAVVVHETDASGRESVITELVSGDPQRLLDGDKQAITVRSLEPQAGDVSVMGKKEYISCIVFCVGANCAGPASRCRGLIFMAAVLACMVAVCGSKVRVCHRVCKRHW